MLYWCVTKEVGNLGLLMGTNTGEIKGNPRKIKLNLFYTKM